MLRPRRLLFCAALSLALGATSCAPVDENAALTEAGEETGLMEALQQVPEEVVGASSGPVVPNGAATEVWAVRNAWADTTTADARKEGPGWPANSGLTWEQKFDRWVASFQRVPRHVGSGSTFRITTPWGDRAFDAPTLECAEVAMFLRSTFAAWYGLPFFMQGWSSTDGTIYAGHFGFVTRAGARVRNFPSFRTQYRDYTSTYRMGMTWPRDARLRAMRLGQDDAVPFLEGPNDSTPAGAGTYFDELHLNKRVGYFQRLLLLYFGSANLSDGNNMFHIRPLHTSAGDILIERWQKRGIGHVLPVMRVDNPMEGRIAASLASGSMPRRQPYWEEPDSAISTFTLAYTGGVGAADDGTPYARLGGGIRRWRTAVLRNGRWMNEVLPADEAAYIADSDVATISSRPEEFRRIWANISPEARRDAAIGRIEAARAHLRLYPASCSARTRREDSFAELYQVMQENFRQTRAQVDARYRTLEDFVYAELDYTTSKTCCWNSTTGNMAEIVMDFAQAEQRRAQAAGMCAQPTVFRNEGGAGDGYNRWRTHAMSIGRGAQWVTWSEDEPCMQRAVGMDTVTARGPQYCPRPR